MVRADSGINSLNDLQGKRFAFVDPASTSGHLYPKTLLLSKGFDPKTFFSKTVFAGSHNAVVLSIYKGEVDGGAAYDGFSGCGLPNLTRMFLKKIKVLAYTKEIPNDTVSVRKELPEGLKVKLRNGLKKISDSPKGSKILKRLYGISGLMESGWIILTRYAKRGDCWVLTWKILMLKIEQLCKTYKKGTEALRDVSLKVEAGEFLVVLGKSGSGKSTLLRCINRLIEPTSGRIFFNDEEITGATKGKLRQLRKKIGMVFQQYNIVPRCFCTKRMC